MNNINKIYETFGSNICLFPYMAGFYSLVSTHLESTPMLAPCSSIKVNGWDIKDNSLISSINSEQWKELRRTFVSNGSCHTTDFCKTCSLAETNGGDSPRKINNEYFAEHLSSDIIKQVQEVIDNDYKVEKILSLDYCPSNYCNYECIMCFSGASTRRREIDRILFMEKYPEAGKPPKNQPLFAPTADFYQIVSQLEILNFTGGETLLQKQVHELIDYLTSQDLAKNITISLLTNVSKYPTDLLDKFKKFKNVFYTLSIDGVGEMIEYQRRGAVWTDIETNALRFQQEFGCVFNYVLTGVNVFGFVEFIDWVAKHNIDQIFISLVYDRNRNISVAVIPPELKIPLLEKLYACKISYTGTAYESLIIQVIGILENTKHDPDLISEFVKAIKIEDRFSKKKLIEIVTEWAPYFK